MRCRYLDKLYKEKNIEGLKREIQRSQEIIELYRYELAKLLDMYAPYELNKVKENLSFEEGYLAKAKKYLYNLLKQNEK